MGTLQLNQSVPLTDKGILRFDSPLPSMSHRPDLIALPMLRAMSPRPSIFLLMRNSTSSLAVDAYHLRHTTGRNGTEESDGVCDNEQRRYFQHRGCARWLMGMDDGPASVETSWQGLMHELPFWIGLTVQLYARPDDTRGTET